MSYISPFHIIAHFYPEAETGEELNFSRLQKKIMAEFNLTHSAVITINGADYSKDQLIKIIDNLFNDQSLALHRIIYNVPAVLNFLEQPKSTPDKEVIRLFFKFNAMSGYLPYLEKKFEEAMHSHLKYNLSLNNYHTFSASRDFFEELIPESKNGNDQLIYDQLINLSAYIQSLFHMGNRSDYMENKIRDDFSFIYKENFPEFLNNLSWEFDEIVSKLVNDLLRLIQYCNKNYIISIDLLLQISYALESVKTLDGHINERIRTFSRFLEAEKNTDASPFFEKEVSTKNTKKEHGERIFTWVVFAIMILVFSGYFISDEQRIKSVCLLISGSLLAVIVIYEQGLRNK